MVDRIIPHHCSKDVHALMSRTCEYVTLNGKRDYTNVFKLRTLRWRDYPGLSEGAQSNYHSPHKL